VDGQLRLVTKDLNEPFDLDKVIPIECGFDFFDVVPHLRVQIAALVA
jgi:hypothetical protein